MTRLCGENHEVKRHMRSCRGACITTLANSALTPRHVTLLTKQGAPVIMGVYANEELIQYAEQSVVQRQRIHAARKRKWDEDQALKKKHKEDRQKGLFAAPTPKRYHAGSGDAGYMHDFMVSKVAGHHGGWPQDTIQAYQDLLEEVHNGSEQFYVSPTERYYKVMEPNGLLFHDRNIPRWVRVRGSKYKSKTHGYSHGDTASNDTEPRDEDLEILPSFQLDTTEVDFHQYPYWSTIGYFLTQLPYAKNVNLLL